MQSKWQRNADLSATDSIKLIHGRNPEFSFHNAIQFIRQFMRSKYQNELLSKIGSKCGKRLLLYVPDKTRWEAMAAFRLLTGHFCLAEHLNCIVILVHSS